MPRRFVKSQHPGDMGGRWVEDEYQAGAEGGRQATQMSEREIKRMIEESANRQAAKADRRHRPVEMPEIDLQIPRPRIRREEEQEWRPPMLLPDDYEPPGPSYPDLPPSLQVAGSLQDAIANLGREEEPISLAGSGFRPSQKELPSFDPQEALELELALSEIAPVEVGPGVDRYDKYLDEIETLDRPLSGPRGYSSAHRVLADIADTDPLAAPGVERLTAEGPGVTELDKYFQGGGSQDWGGVATWRNPDHWLRANYGSYANPIARSELRGREISAPPDVGPLGDSVNPYAISPSDPYRRSPLDISDDLDSWGHSIEGLDVGVDPTEWILTPHGLRRREGGVGDYRNMLRGLVSPDMPDAERAGREFLRTGVLNRASGGIVSLAGGGYVPMYASGGVPGYGIGGFLKGLGKFALKAAPMALSFIPGVSGLSGLAKAGIGAALTGASGLAEGKGLNLQSMLGGAGRAYAASSAVDRMNKELSGGTWDQMSGWEKMKAALSDPEAGKAALGAAANIPVGEALGLGVTEAAAQRGAAEQAGQQGGFGSMQGMVNPMGTAGRTMPGQAPAGGDSAGGYASQMTYGSQAPIEYNASGGMIPGFQMGGFPGEEALMPMPGKQFGRSGSRYGRGRGRSRPPVRAPWRPPVQKQLPPPPPPPPVAPPPPPPMAGPPEMIGAPPPPAAPPMPPPQVAPPPPPPQVQPPPQMAPPPKPIPPPPPQVRPPPAPGPRLDRGIPGGGSQPIGPQGGPGPGPQMAPPPPPPIEENGAVWRPPPTALPNVPPPSVAPPPPPPAQAGVPQAQVDPSMVPEWEDLQPIGDPRAQVAPPPPPPPVRPPQPVATDLGVDIEEVEGIEDVLPDTVSRAKSKKAKKAKKARKREEIPDLPEEPLVYPSQVPPGYNPLTGQGYVGPGSQGRPEGGGDVGGPPDVVEQIRDVVPGTTSTMPPVPAVEPAPTGYDPTTGTGYVPPGGIPQEPEPLPQGAGKTDTSGGVKPTDWLKAEFKKQNPDSDFTDADIIRWAAETGTPNTEGGWEGGPKAGVELEDVSTPPPDPNQQFGGELPGDPGGEPEDGGDEGTLVGSEDERHRPSTAPVPGSTARPPQPKPYIPPPIDRVMPGGGPPTGGPPTGGGPLATRAGTGAGSGFYGEQKWFDPNAPDPAKRDIGGFNPHELPRTSADFTAAGDAGGAGLLDRLNAPAAPVQDYLAAPTPPPIPSQAGGVVVQPIPLDQVPQDIIEKVAEAANDIESFESQQDIQDAINDLGGDKRALDTVQQLIAIIRQQYSQVPAQVGMTGMPEQSPQMAYGGVVPEYGLGGFLKKALKVGTFGATQLLPQKIRDPINKAALKIAPVAANFIPGVGPVAAAGIGAVAKGIDSKIDADRARDAATAAPQASPMAAPQPQQAAAPALPAPQQPQRYMPDPAAQQAPVEQGLAGQMTYGQEGWDRGGLINGGGGDAMADDIYVNAEMGMNGEKQTIAVSAGEYIIPGDVVGHLGSGNTQGGAEVLDQFVEDVRVDRTGSPTQPGPIDLSDVLPGTYGGKHA